MGEKTRVLVVDDNVSQCKTMSFILEHKGCAVAIAESGPEAIEIAKKNPFDIIFMDIKMPVMNGVEAYKQIKKIRPGAKAIMMTAYALEDLIGQALAEGAYGILYKPLDIKKMFDLIETGMEKRKS
jgi:CheY-like chemotaxis protein